MNPIRAWTSHEPAALSFCLWRNGYPAQDLPRILPFLAALRPVAVEAGTTIIREGDVEERAYGGRAGPCRGGARHALGRELEL